MYVFIGQLGRVAAGGWLLGGWRESLGGWVAGEDGRAGRPATGGHNSFFVALRKAAATFAPRGRFLDGDDLRGEHGLEGPDALQPVSQHHWLRLTFMPGGARA